MTQATYIHHRITAAPRRWQAVADALARNAAGLPARGGALYGAWRSQIGRPRDEIIAITYWADAIDADSAEAALIGTLADIERATSLAMAPTLRPVDPTPPVRQGNFAFRWFITPETNWSEFLVLCAQAWPGFEAAYDSQVIGLWQCPGAVRDEASGPLAAGQIRSLLLTRRPDLAMWERSKLPQGAAETAVRDALSRRYDLCSWTVVYTTTLLTAADSADTARWA